MCPPLTRLLVLSALVLTTSATAAPRPGRLTLDDLRRSHLLRAAPAPLAAPVPALVPPLPSHQVGDPRAFWTYDLSVMPPKNKQVPSTCRAVGDSVAVYVADGEWPGKVDQADVDAIVAAFDVDTPMGDGVGITARNTALFGATSDIDGDGRLIVFIYAIAGYQGNMFDGFFRAEDLGPNQPGCATNPMLYCSNEAEMIHVNSTNAGSAYMIGVMAHEFQHLLHFVADPNEESWINEAMSELAMSVSGYDDTGNLHGYLNDPAAPLETAEYVDYGAAMLWGTWLYERHGADFVHALVAAPANGRPGLAAAWATVGVTATYEETFADWSLANVVDGPGDLGYALLDLPHFPPDGAIPGFFAGSTATTLTVPPSSFKWLQDTLDGANDVVVSIPSGSATGLRVASYVEGAATLAVEDDATTWTIPASAQANPAVVVLANPTLSAQTVTVSFYQVLSRPEAQPEPVTEATPDESEPDVVAEAVAETEPDATLPDAASPEGTRETVAPEVVPGDAAGAETDGGGGGTCSMTPSAGPGAFALLLASLGLVICRRLRAPRPIA